jgi:hypothetical protein
MTYSSQARLKWLERILEERFGLQLKLDEGGAGLTVRLSNADGRIVFDKLEASFKERSPDIPCAQWCAQREGWDSILGSDLPAPGVARLPEPLVEVDAKGYVVHYDILGLAYWMLNRLEEIGFDDLDEHGRFPATAAHGYKHDYLDRPIVDEWLHVLGQILRRAWPQVELTEHRYRLLLSHDVDRPFQYLFLPISSLVRQLSGDVFKRRDLRLAGERLEKWARVKAGRIECDPFNTFDWLMDVSERHGLKSAFYFLAGGKHPLDGDYSFAHAEIRALLRKIHSRGHEIGLHPSYTTFRDVQALVHEARHLREVCEEEGIRQEQWGGRMHYLRWQQPLTLHAWEAANMAYDSTMNYGEHPGFRAGTCFEYPAFDVEEDEMLQVRERPLIVMNGASYGSSSAEQPDAQHSIEHLKLLIQRCKKVGGIFTLLWHNSDLDPSNRYVYMRLLAEAAG